MSRPDPARGSEDPKRSEVRGIDRLYYMGEIRQFHQLSKHIMVKDVCTYIKVTKLGFFI